jgi:hypothetical protein
MQLNYFAQINATDLLATELARYSITYTNVQLQLKLAVAALKLARPLAVPIACLFSTQYSHMVLLVARPTYMTWQRPPPPLFPVAAVTLTNLCVLEFRTQLFEPPS